MKKILLLYIFLSSNLFFGQEFTVTPEGLKNKENIEKNYIVLDVKDKKASELYQKSRQFVNVKYKNPEKVIKGKIENEYLRFETFSQDLLVHTTKRGSKTFINATYYTELRFKEGKVKFEITSIDMKSTAYSTKLYFSGGGNGKTFRIYNEKNGKLFREQIKIALENYFNNHVSDYLDFLNKKKKEEDW
ncbi:hypothetical protein ACFFU1_16625 [Algibacter miyuki]|uniref:DUF4468 domain-containing protein n=1 Tax=Algibacter miyuki TaxID=1306933 RepID=A0ABV5H5E7_9FLAO|nr:hypothetical protein [Algibacter miyuki]MDN3665604.1 hypothetical protein [Algibacter miyuki]